MQTLIAGKIVSEQRKLPVIKKTLNNNKRIHQEDNDPKCVYTKQHRCKTHEKKLIKPK